MPIVSEWMQLIGFTTMKITEFHPWLAHNMRFLAENQ